MLPPPPPDLRPALRAAARGLARVQAPDGRLADYQLPPGAADGWTTALAAVALAETLDVLGPDPHIAAALQRAADHLEAEARPAGWGYSRTVAVDADSTAFALRALVRAGRPLDPDAARRTLGRFLTPAGHARTFADTARMGAWAHRHDDVTPSVGLALLQLSAAPEQLTRLAVASRSAQQPTGTWAAYWWRHPWYATWLNLCWLNRSGHASDALRTRARASLGHLQGTLSALDLACVLGVLHETGATPDDPALDAVMRRLLDLQQADGRLPPSAALMLPPQRPGGPLDGPYADLRGIVTTAVALLVLAAIQRHAQPPPPAALELP